MGDIFREIDEELKQERLEKFWRRHGKLIVAGAVLLVAAVAGWKFWQNHQTSLRHEEGQKFGAAAALLQEGKTAEAQAAFAALAGNTDSGYGTLARFYQAAMAAKAGEVAASVRAYDAIAADGSVSAPMQGLAAVLGALQALRLPTFDAAAFERRLAGLAADGNPYRYSALELLAIGAQKAGDREKAARHYRAIVDDVNAPAGTRARASQMLTIIDPAGSR